MGSGKRRQLLLTTTVLVGALTGYGGRAYGACVNVGGSTFQCSGAETVTQSLIGANNGEVSTVAGFSVDTTVGGGSGGNAITIVGDGALSYTDNFNSSLSAVAIALSIDSPGDYGATPGSITVNANGTLTGTYGIVAVSRGSGALSVTTNGDVTGTNNDGIFVRDHNGTDVTVKTGASTAVSGSNRGIYARNDGSGTLTITANGDITGTNNDGIFASNGISGTPAGTDLTITTGVGTTVKGGFSGISANNNGIGMLTVTANGDVKATSPYGVGIDARNSGTDLTVTTGAGTTVSGRSGIQASNHGSGALTVTANGDVSGTGTSGTGISAENNSGTFLSVTTGEGTTIAGVHTGISASNNGIGMLTVTANGDVKATSPYGVGIDARNSGTDLTVTTGAGTTVSGRSGISANNYGSGALTITANGDVSGTGSYGTGIYARNGGYNTPSSSSLAIITGAGTTIAGAYSGISAKSNGSGPIDINVGVSSVIKGGTKAGVELEGGGKNSITNEGTIISLNGVAILATTGDETVKNTGRIEGLTDLGSGNNTINNSGEMVANSPVIITGDGNDAVINSGTITGEVDLGEGDNTFTNLAGGVFNAGTSILLGAGNNFTNTGTLSPGGVSTIQTTYLVGNFIQRRGGILEVDVNAAGQGDKVIVKGTVNLTGSTLRVLAANGNYKPLTDYVIIDNDGSDAVKGEFASITNNYAFLTSSVTYDAGDGNDVVLTLLRTVTPRSGTGTGYLSFCSVAQTQNQCNVAHALDKFPTTNPLFLAVLTQTAAGARQAFDALSGEAHASIAGTLADDSRYVREAVLGRLIQAGAAGSSNDQVASLAAAGPQVASLDQQAMAVGYGDKPLSAPVREPLAFWTRAYGAWGNYDGNGNAATADRDLGGFMSGMDAQVSGSWRVGLATGASFSNVSVSDRYSSADVESYSLGGYTGGMAGAFALRGGGMWAWSNIDTSRAVVFPGFFERQNASYDADTGQLFGEVAYPMSMGGMAVEPFGGLAYVSVDTDTFKEHGGSLASLRGRGADQDVGYSTLGLRAASTMHWGEMLVTPHVSAAWQHAFDDVTPAAALAFASTGIGFSITGVPLAEDSALIDAGLDFALGARTTAGVSYSGQFGDGVQDNAVKGRFAWVF